MNESDTQQNEFADPRTSSGLRGVDLHDDGSVLHAALVQLSNSEREMIRLKFQENLHYKKISQYLGVSSNVVAKAIHKILLKMKFILAGGNLADFEDKTTSRKFDKYHPKFTAYALGEVSEDDRRKGKDYLGRHPELRADIEELRSLGKAIIAELEINPLPKLKKPIKFSFAKIKNELVSQWEQRPAVFAGGAFVLVLLMMVSMYRLGQSSQNEFTEISKPLASGLDKPKEDQVIKDESVIQSEAKNLRVEGAKPEPVAASNVVPNAPAPATAPAPNSAPVAAKPAVTQSPVSVNQSAVKIPPAKPVVNAVTPGAMQKPMAQSKLVPQVKVTTPNQKLPAQQNIAPIAQLPTQKVVEKTVSSVAKPVVAVTTAAPVPAPAVEKKPEPVVQAVPAVAQVAPKPTVPEAPAKPAAASSPLAKLGGVNLSALNLGTNSLVSKGSGPKFQGAVASNLSNRPSANDDLKVGEAKPVSSKTPGEPRVTGGLTPEDISGVINANAGQAESCFQDLLKRTPGAKGKMVMDFVISAEGKVTKALVSSSTINDSIMRGCLTVKLKSWKFPKSSDGQVVKVQYPFIF